MTIENYIYLTIFFIYGLLIGSFLNVCIYRIPLKIGVSKGRSFCPNCNHSLKATDLIPVFSYLFLGRKCRYCKNKISMRYMAIEILTAILFSLVYLKFGVTTYSILACILSATLVVVAFIDLDTKEIPNRLSLIILILSVLSIINVLLNNFLNSTEIFTYEIYIKLIGLIAISLPMFLIAYFFNGFGGGDIKLMASAGLFIGTYNIVLAFFIGVFIAFFYCIYILIKHKAKGKTAIAFGPYLSIGIFIAMLYGKDIIDWYLKFF